MPRSERVKWLRKAPIFGKMDAPSVRMAVQEVPVDRKCPRCGEMKPLSEFVPDRTKASGYASRCKPCDRIKCREYWARKYPDGPIRRNRDLAERGLRHCGSCRRDLPLSEFTPKGSTQEGLNTRCRGCDRERGREGRELRRARAIRVYGGFCVICGSRRDLEFDHVDWNGAEHRKKESSTALIRRIARTGKQIDEYRLRLLCRECHDARSIAFHDVLRQGPWDLEKVEGRLRELRHSAIYRHA